MQQLLLGSTADHSSRCTRVGLWPFGGLTRRIAGEPFAELASAACRPAAGAGHGAPLLVLSPLHVETEAASAHYENRAKAALSGPSNRADEPFEHTIKCCNASIGHTSTVYTVHKCIVRYSFVEIANLFSKHEVSSSHMGEGEAEIDNLFGKAI